MALERRQTARHVRRGAVGHLFQPLSLTLLIGRPILCQELERQPRQHAGRGERHDEEHDHELPRWAKPVGEAHSLWKLIARVHRDGVTSVKEVSRDGDRKTAYRRKIRGSGKASPDRSGVLSTSFASVVSSTGRSKPSAPRRYTRTTSSSGSTTQYSDTPARS